ncbi:uncharacterized protein LOC119034199 isoform X2 [Scomber scombrus]|uniref:Uncharacterized protein LOC119034199 isoform X2 n=1 Tax=Scomber scombrus TaxID=13677 RepID=A0AAV1P571_SCOSC
MEEKLIVAVCGHPVLYDTTAVFYRERYKKEEAWAKVGAEVGLADQSLSESVGTAPAAASPAAAAPASGARTRKRKRGTDMDVGEKERETLIQGLLIQSLQRAPAATTTTTTITTTCLERRGTFLKQSGSFPP